MKVWLSFTEICRPGPMKRLRVRNDSWRKAVRAAIALFCLIAGFAPAGKAAPHSPPSRPFSDQVASQFAIADFDGDSRPDIATVEVGQSNSSATRYWIGFRLSTGSQQTVGLAAPTGGLRLRSGDVNGDSYPDVIVTTLWTGQPVAVLLNDGRGNFTRSEPSAFPGAFADSESSLSSRTERITDTAALVFSRYLPGQCEERSSTALPANASGRPASRTLHFVALLIADSSSGRAPPSVALHSQSSR